MRLITHAFHQISCLGPRRNETETQEAPRPLGRVTPRSVPSSAALPATAQHSHGLNTQHAGRVQPVSLQQAQLPVAKFYFRHPQHGEVNVQRALKAAGKNEIQFTITHQGCTVTHTMYVSDHDSNHHDASTLGYGDIFLPENMQDKGISYLLHFAAADAAERLGTEKFVIDNVVSDAMRRVCNKLGMEDDGDLPEYYSGDPVTVKDQCDSHMRQKGWMRQQSASSASGAAAVLRSRE